MATIKKIILLALTVVLMASCEDFKTTSEQQKEEGTFERWHGFEVRVVDSCEYIIRADTKPNGHQGYGYGFFAHKGNCKFCKERKKQELKELLEELK